MAEVVLVQMPWAALQRPSIALGMLQASLGDLSCLVRYANLWWAEATGPGVDQYPVECLVGEWVFSGAAFPDFHPDADAYYRLALPKADAATRARLEALRELAPAFVDLAARRVLQDRPRIVGCSSVFQQHCASLALLRRLKELDPSLVTMLGGANCEGPMGRVTRQAFPWVDYVVSGEAEEIFPELCRQALTGRVDLPGVYGADCHEPERLVVERLDASPVPDYRDYFAALAASPLAPSVSPGLLIETSRGCWWGQKHHCTFCGLNGVGMSYRSKSAPRILEEFASQAERYGMRDFEVVDNIINMSHLDTVLARLPAGYNLFYETKANLRHPQLEALRRAGVGWIQPGIESLHDEVLKLMDKGTTALINVQLLKWARELGMRVNWNLIMGFPGEKTEWYLEMLHWLPLISHLQPPLGAGYLRYDRFSPYHSQSARYGLSLSPTPTYAFVYPLPPEQLAELAYFFEDSPGEIRRLREAGPYAPLCEYLGEWYRLSQLPLPTVLSLDDDGETLHFLDTRPCAPARRQSLSGEARELYLACDRARSPENLPGSEALLRDLVERKLLLELNGKYLALATRGDLPGGGARYPGGEVLHALPSESSDPELRALSNRLEELIPCPR